MIFSFLFVFFSCCIVLLLLEVPVFEISVLKCESFLFSLAPFLKIKVDICSLKLGKREREGGRERDGENERGR